MVDLQVMEISEFYVILGMDWMTAHHVVIDYYCRRDTIYTQDGIRVMFQGDKHDALPQALYDSRWHKQLMGWRAGRPYLRGQGEIGFESTSCGL